MALTVPRYICAPTGVVYSRTGRRNWFRHTVDDIRRVDHEATIRILEMALSHDHDRDTPELAMRHRVHHEQWKELARRADVQMVGQLEAFPDA